MKKLGYLFFMLSLSIFSISQKAAAEAPGDIATGMATKLGRGLYNVVSSPAEIPCTMNKDIKAEGGVGAATGFGKGIAFMLRRILVGVTEVGTFVIPAEKTIPLVCQESIY